MDLTEIITQLTEIESASLAGDISPLFLEIVRTGGGDDEITFRGNREGLIHLGLLCLDLAARRSEGSHHHFDRVSTSRADVSVVVAYKSAFWEKENQG